MMQSKNHLRFSFSSKVPKSLFGIKEPTTVRYTLAYVFGSLTIFVCAGLPVMYWLNQNYSLFSNLAQTASPSLIRYLEREKIWINVLMLSSGCLFLLLNATLIYRLTHRFIGPAIAMERHIKKLALGNWATPELTIRKDDELHGLLAQYDYFYKSLQAVTLTELKQLEKLSVDPDNVEAYSIWQNLMRTKRERLGFAEIATENVLAAASNRGLRRVS